MAAVQPQDRSGQLVRAITGIASLLALFSALLYYFGWVRSDDQAKAFGADASVFGMTSQELVIRSTDVLFVPLLVALLGSVLAMWGHGRLVAMVGHEAGRRRVARLSRALRLSWLVALVAAVALLVAASSSARQALPFLFAFGLGGSWYGFSLKRHVSENAPALPTPLFLALAALLAVCTFWMTERIAGVVAEARVQSIKADVAGTLEGVSIYSAQRLQLAGAQLRERALDDPKAAYRYRYDGAYLLQKSGGDYFLLTDGWDTDEGRLIVLPDDASIRLEFGPGR